MPNQLEIKLRILCGDEIAVGPGKIQLLNAIMQHGSISAAARSLGMSYRRAWMLVDTMNHCFREPIVETLAGGTRGGGALVTKAGKTMMATYLAMQRKSEAAVQSELKKLLKTLNPS